MAINAGKRELIDGRTDKCFVKREYESLFTKSVDVERSPTADRCSKYEPVAESGTTDKGEQPERSIKKADTMYSRRSFASRLGLFCCALPLTMVAQQLRPHRVRRIGFLSGAVPTLIKAFEDELGRLARELAVKASDPNRQRP